MTTSEKTAYLKGLADGLAIDPATNEGKMFAAVIDAFEAVARDIKALEENDLDLSEEIDSLSDDLADIEDIVYGDKDDDCCASCRDGGEFPEIYEVRCPKCGIVMTIDKETLDSGETECANCGEELELDFDGDGSDDGE
ncbi:MAG: hypothetical protein FWG32_06740 [Oscillospiraceae bacterium]|nr:hypothetical protein [Oscillospiraceae bacterium]